MKSRLNAARAIVLCLVFIAAAASFPLQAQDRPVQSDQDILMQLERDWDAAFLTRDVRTIDNILATEFMATYDDGSRGDRARELSLAAEFNQNIESSKLDDFTVKVYGDTAVVWFSRHLVGVSRGQRLELTFQYIDVFIFRAGRWQCIASQSTKVNK
jgi:ketosteroid isomerase-like protein